MSFETGPFEIQAHRGNDLVTLRRLLDARPDSVEIDVAVTADGAAVCSHELVASELECRSSPLLGREWRELSRADAVALGRPTFSRALAVAGDVSVVAEAKCVPGRTVAPARFAAALAPFLGRIAVVSFDERVLTAARRLEPALATTFLFERPMRIATGARTVGPSADLVTPDLVQAAHALGLRVVPWTVNDPHEMATLVDLGVDGLVTDEPALARAVCAGRVELDPG